MLQERWSSRGPGIFGLNISRILHGTVLLLKANNNNKKEKEKRKEKKRKKSNLAHNLIVIQARWDLMVLTKTCPHALETDCLNIDFSPIHSGDGEQCVVLCAERRSINWARGLYLQGLWGPSASQPPCLHKKPRMQPRGQMDTSGSGLPCRSTKMLSV